MCPWYHDPSWWEAIGTVSAIIITLIIIMGSKLRNYLYSPNITASDPTISYKRPQSHTGTRGRIQLSWKLYNEPKLFSYGGIAVNIVTRFWFDKKDHEGWTYADDLRPLPILPKKETWRQKTKVFEGELEETEYILILVFYQTGLEDKSREYVIGHAEFTIPWSQKGFLRPLRLDLP